MRNGKMLHKRTRKGDGGRESEETRRGLRFFCCSTSEGEKRKRKKRREREISGERDLKGSGSLRLISA